MNKQIFNELYNLVNEYYFDIIENEEDTTNWNKRNELITKCNIEFVLKNVGFQTYELSYIVDYFNLKTKLFVNIERPKDFDTLKHQFSNMLELQRQAA